MPADSITGEPGSSMLKLRSMYAESPEDCLKFIQVGAVEAVPFPVPDALFYSTISFFSLSLSCC